MLRRTLPLLWGSSLIFATACGSAGGFVEDTGPERPDSGLPTDTGPRPDLGAFDAGPQPDLGPLPDLGPRPDTGPQPDMGPQPDGGPIVRPSYTETAIDTNIIHGQGLEVVDIEGDGDLDVLASLSLTDAVHLYVNDGNGGFSPVVVGTGIVAMETAVADFDGDGDNDIAAVGLFERSGGFTSAGEVVWYENPGKLSGAWTRRNITGFTFWGGLYIEAGDLTGDGRADLVVGAIQLADTNGNPQGNGVHWFRNTGGDFAGPTPIDANLLEVATVAIADVDGSGALDVIALGANANEVAWWQSGRPAGTPQDNPTFTKHVIGTPGGPYGMHYVNMDFDPALELLVTANDVSISYYDPPADPTAAWSRVSIATGLGGALASRIFGADFDGNGQTDIAVGFAEAAQISVYYRTDAAFEAQSVASAYTNLNWLTGGDFNGDQRVDLATATYNPGGGNDTIAWWRNQR